MLRIIIGAISKPRQPLHMVVSSSLLITKQMRFYFIIMFSSNASTQFAIISELFFIQSIGIASIDFFKSSFLAFLFLEKDNQHSSVCKHTYVPPCGYWFKKHSIKILIKNNFYYFLSFHKEYSNLRVSFRPSFLSNNNKQSFLLKHILILHFH